MSGRGGLTGSGRRVRQDRECTASGEEADQHIICAKAELKPKAEQPVAQTTSAAATTTDTPKTTTDTGVNAADAAMTRQRRPLHK